VSDCITNDRLMFNCIIDVNSTFHAYFFPRYESPPKLMHPRVASSSLLSIILLPSLRLFNWLLLFIVLVSNFFFLLFARLTFLVIYL